jgi:hypothetical protein
MHREPGADLLDSRRTIFSDSDDLNKSLDGGLVTGPPCFIPDDLQLAVQQIRAWTGTCPHG